MHVGETFLHHAEQRRFRFGGEAAEIVVDGDLHVNAAALAETFGVPANGGAEAALVE